MSFPADIIKELQHDESFPVQEEPEAGRFEARGRKEVTQNRITEEAKELQYRDR